MTERQDAAKAIIRRLIDGTTTPDAAAAELGRLGIFGLAMGGPGLSPRDMAKLEAVGPALTRAQHEWLAKNFPPDIA